ncbi:MAG: hypothetical protein SH820_14205 [Xanthomonadales bacterium]|nr:hypothetical protein [Xanthomonadales bacterium]
MNHQFPGNPSQYLKIAIVSTIAFIIWLYGGTALILWLSSGETWLLGWKVILAVIVFALWYCRYAYRWMMRLDGQYGSGSGWDLSETTVKLPEIRTSNHSKASQGSRDS